MLRGVLGLMSKLRFVAYAAMALLFVGISVYSNLSRATPSSPTVAPLTMIAMPDVDPEKVVGRDKCAACHNREIEAWQESAHAKTAFAKLGTADAKKWGDALGIADVKTDRFCISCHGTPRMDGGSLVIEEGNSCESCHGAAGGEDGWFEAHGDFGLPYENMDDLIAQRIENKEDPDHRRQRFETCFKSGMNRADDVMAIVKNCLECHAVPIAELAELGHPSSDKFEFVEWAQGEVRHNFLLDRETNAESPSGWLAFRKGSTADGRKRLMFVIGQLADLEFSFRTRSRIVAKNELLDRTEDRIKDAVKAVRKFDKEFEDGEELTDEEKTMFTDFYEAMDELADEVGDLADDDAAKYMAAADRVAELAFNFVRAFPDGSRIPEGIKVPSRGKGDVYEP